MRDFQPVARKTDCRGIRHSDEQQRSCPTPPNFALKLGGRYRIWLMAPEGPRVVATGGAAAPHSPPTPNPWKTVCFYSSRRGEGCSMPGTSSQLLLKTSNPDWAASSASNSTSAKAGWPPPFPTHHRQKVAIREHLVQLIRRKLKPFRAVRGIEFRGVRDPDVDRRRTGNGGLCELRAEGRSEAALEHRAGVVDEQSLNSRLFDVAGSEGIRRLPVARESGEQPPDGAVAPGDHVAADGRRAVAAVCRRNVRVPCVPCLEWRGLIRSDCVSPRRRTRAGSFRYAS